MIGAGILLVYISITIWPVSWFHETIVIPVTNLLTFGHFEDVFTDVTHKRLLIYGMLAANGWFRDAHKYGGILGWVNSWIIGFVMMYACLHYGLLLTITVHALYDLEFVLLSFFLSYACN